MREGARERQRGERERERVRERKSERKREGERKRGERERKSEGEGESEGERAIEAGSSAEAICFFRTESPGAETSEAFYSNRRDAEVRKRRTRRARQQRRVGTRRFISEKKDFKESEKMPRVVPDQRSKFENEEFFRKLSRECEVGAPRRPDPSGR